ncbi:hypothetical protein ACC710_36755, partial [Rhizobium ruizarguesonis]
ITIGLIAPLTGPVAAYGDQVKNGAQTAVDEISRNFGEIPQVDNKMERKSARSSTKSSPNRRSWLRLLISWRVPVTRTIAVRR